MKSVLGDRRAIAILLGPALLVYTLVMLIPFVWSFGYTVMTGNPIFGFTFNGLANFQKLFADPIAWQAIGFSIRYALVATVLQIVLGYLLALMYHFWLKKSSPLVRSLIFFPAILPTVAVGLLFQRLFQVVPQPGVVNSILEFFGGSSTDWLGSAGSAFWVIVVMEVWKSMGFFAVLLYTGIIDIPDDILESARLDGASGFRLVRHIVLPMTLPVVLSSVIFSINGSLKVFDSVLALTAGGPGRATTPLTLYMYQTSFTYGDYGYGSTLALALTILCFIVTLFIFRSYQRDNTGTAK